MLFIPLRGGISPGLISPTLDHWIGRGIGRSISMPGQGPKGLYSVHPRGLHPRGLHPPPLGGAQGGGTSPGSKGNKNRPGWDTLIPGDRRPQKR